MILVVAMLAGSAAALLPRPRSRRRRTPIAWSVPVRPLVAGLVVYAVVGGTWGVLLGCAAAVVAGRRARSSPGPVGASWSGTASVLVELIAAAIQAGVPPTLAVSAAADALGPPHSAGLARVVERWRYGLSASDVELDTPSGLIARAIEQAQDSGAAPAVALEHVAVDLAAEAGLRAEERARRVGVQAALPLGVCLLPAFVLVGVVPLVASVMTGVAR